MKLTKDDKKRIKQICRVFNAQRLWIDGEEYNVLKEKRCDQVKN